MAHMSDHPSSAAGGVAGNYSGRRRSRKSTRVDRENTEFVDPQWSQARQTLGRFFSSHVYDTGLSLLIMANLALLIVETDASAKGEDIALGVKVPYFCLLIIYVIELGLRLYVYRLLFFDALQNWADLAIVTADVVIEIMAVISSDINLPSFTTMLRLFRLVRLGRIIRVLVMFPVLHLMLKGLIGAFRAIFWGCLLILLMLTFWSIVAVQLIDPINKEVAAAGGFEGCERCPRAFESVGQALLTLTQHIVAGDSWGTVCVPIVEARPWTFVFFLLILVTVGMGILNLILAVIVDAASEARKENDHEIAKMKEAEFEGARDRLRQICESMDKDGSGSLTWDELKDGYQENLDFADAMTVMDVGEEDMSTVFHILDTDRSGDVRYDEFVQQVYKMKSNDSHTMLIFIKFYVQEIRHKICSDLHEQVEYLKDQITGMHGTLTTQMSMKATGTADVKREAAEQPHEEEKKDVHRQGVRPPPPPEATSPTSVLPQGFYKESEMLRKSNEDLAQAVRELVRTFEANTSRALSTGDHGPRTSPFSPPVKPSAAPLESHRALPGCCSFQQRPPVEQLHLTSRC